MAVRKRTTFTTVRTESGLLPADLLQRITDGDRELGGLSPQDYHLTEGERLNEAINRSWSRLVGIWAGFQSAASKLNPGDAATGLTRERWLLILFQELSYGRLQLAKGLEAGGKPFAISHQWLTMCRQSSLRSQPAQMGRRIDTTNTGGAEGECRIFRS